MSRHWSMAGPRCLASSGKSGARVTIPEILQTTFFSAARADISSTHLYGSWSALWESSLESEKALGSTFPQWFTRNLVSGQARASAAIWANQDGDTVKSKLKFI